MVRRVVIHAVCALSCAEGTAYAQTRPAADLVARVRDGNGADLGAVTLTKAPKGVLLEVRLKGLPPGPRGLHFHGIAECKPPSFVSSGPHQNGEARNHGFLAPTGYHTGDLPNLYVGPDGIAQMDVFLPGAGLTPGQKGAIANASGVSIVVKSAADDYFSDPTGNSGSRLACGVFAPPASLADADLARREAELAQREAELARKEAELQARATAVPQPAVDPVPAAQPALPSAPSETAVGLPAAPPPAALPATGAQIIQPGAAAPPVLGSPQAPSIKRGPLQVPEDAPPSDGSGTP